MVATFPPPLTTALNGRRIRLARLKDKASLPTAYAVLHARASLAIRAYAAIAPEGQADRAKVHLKTLPTYGHKIANIVANAIYAAAELCEFYLSDIPEYLSLPKKDKGRKRLYEEIKELTYLVRVMCNKMKHGHHFLVPMEISYDSGPTVFGASMCYEGPDGWSPSDILFLKSRCFSYDWLIRHLLATIVLSDQRCAQALGDVEEDSDCVPISMKIGWYHDLFQLVSDLPKYGFPFDKLWQPADVIMENNELRVYSSGEPIVGQLPIRLYVSYPLYSPEFTAQIPYVGKLAVSPESDIDGLHGEIKLFSMSFDIIEFHHQVAKIVAQCGTRPL